MNTDQLIARLVAIADERPNAPIGHVVEHELPELRAKAEAMPSKPSAAQPVARVSVQRYKGHNGYENCDWEWNVDIPPDGNYVLYTAPPDLAARVKELEGLLRLSRPYLDAWQVKRHADDRGIAGLIDAALAEDWK